MSPSAEVGVGFKRQPPSLATRGFSNSGRVAVTRRDRETNIDIAGGATSLGVQSIAMNGRWRAAETFSDRC
jgi:hypothetical protein